MLKKFIFTCLFCFCLSILATQTWAASPPVGANNPAVIGAIDQAKAEAATLLEQRKGQEAYALYSRLLREEPDDDAINLGLARAAILAQKPGHAVMAYERLLTKYPNEPTLHRELAYALSMQNDTMRSAMHMRKDSSTSPEQASDLLNQWNKQHDRLQVNARLRTGMLYDSNVNSGPASNNISLGSWSDLRLKDGKAVETGASYAGGQVDVGYRLDLVSPWWVVGDFQFYARGNYNNKLNDMNMTSSEWGRVSGGIRHLTPETMLDLRLKAEIFDYAFYQNVLATGPETSFVYAITPKTHLITKAGVDRRTYSRNSDYNGWYPNIGEYARFFFGENGHSVIVGAKYLGGFANNNDYSFNGWETSLGFNFKLPWYDLQLSPYASYIQEYYRGPATALEENKREDERLRLGADLIIPINAQWSVEMGYQFTKNHSNSDLYKYKQHLTTLGIAWAF